MRQTNLTLCFATVMALAACGGGSDAVTATDDPNTGGVGPSTNTTVTSTVPVNATASSTVTTANSCGLANFQADVLTAVNAARAQARNCGSTAFAAAAAMRWNDKLFAASAAFCRYGSAK